MKECGKCGEIKPRAAFSKNKTKSDGLQTGCRSCQSEYYKDYYKKHPVKYIKKNNKLRIRNREFVERYKKFRNCEKCGEDRWYVLDFHHKRDKDIEIANMTHQGYSVNKIKEEIRKCSLLCANCHREKHFLEKHGV
jgi:hypothetical protein